MNFYEFNLLITSDFSEEQITSFCKDLISEVKENGSIIGEVAFKQRKLAYPINKENEAWLTVFSLSLQGEDKKLAISGIEKILKSKKEILRYLMLIKSDKAPKIKRKRRSAKKEEVKENVAVEANVEEVNEKVEELLKEEL
ncbi:MAG: 30S ribosomal protein S6 [Candidatus Pacebacteria bacterium]|nr:30S ribosomal protein S6 [Candidatus Paceibacterota bacterium]